eukprot:3771570-Alexandrium_andersonii.AAC.1
MLSHSNFGAPRSGAPSRPVRALSPMLRRPSGGGPREGSDALGHAHERTRRHAHCKLISAL